MAQLDALLDRVRTEHFPRRGGSQSAIDGFERAAGVRLPRDLATFYRAMNGARFFANDDDAPYAIVPLPKMRPLARVVGRADAAPPTWYALCSIENGEWLAIDLAARGGPVMDCFHETLGPGGEAKIVARSFTELLQHVLASKGEPYWQRRFRGYGNGLTKWKAVGAAEGADLTALRAKRAELHPRIDLPRGAKRAALTWWLQVDFAPGIVFGTKPEETFMRFPALSVPGTRSWRKLSGRKATRPEGTLALSHGNASARIRRGTIRFGARTGGTVAVAWDVVVDLGRRGAVRFRGEAKARISDLELSFLVVPKERPRLEEAAAAAGKLVAVDDWQPLKWTPMLASWLFRPRP
jgi:hypothetical protein